MVDGTFKAVESTSKIIVDHTNIVPEKYKGVAKGIIEDGVSLSKDLLDIESEKKSKVSEVRHSGLSTRERIIGENKIYNDARRKTKNTLVKQAGLGVVGLVGGKDAKKYATVLVEGISDGREQGKEAKAEQEAATRRHTSDTRDANNITDEVSEATRTKQSWIEKVEEKIDNNSIINKITKLVTWAQIRLDNAIDARLVKKVHEFGNKMESKSLVQTAGKIAQSVGSFGQTVGNKMTHNSIVTGITQSSIVTSIAHNSIVEKIKDSRPAQKLKDTLTVENETKQLKEVIGMEPVDEPEDPDDNTQSLSVFLHDTIKKSVTNYGDKKEENTDSTYSRLKQFNNENTWYNKPTPTAVSPYASNNINLNNSRTTSVFNRPNGTVTLGNGGNRITSLGTSTTPSNKETSTTNNNRGSNTTPSNKGTTTKAGKKDKTPKGAARE